MTQVIVLNYGVSKDYIASVHKDGCGAIQKDAEDHAAVQYGPYDTVADALSDYIDSEMEDMGYSAADVKVHGCCK